MYLIFVWKFDSVVISDRCFGLLLLFDCIRLFNSVSDHAQGYFIKMSEKLSVTFKVLGVKRSTSSRLLFLTLFRRRDAHINSWLPLRFSCLFQLFKLLIRFFTNLFEIVINNRELGHSVQLHIVGKYDNVFILHQLFEFFVPLLTAHVLEHVVRNFVLFFDHAIKHRKRPLLPLKSDFVVVDAVLLELILGGTLVLGSHIICNAN